MDIITAASQGNLDVVRDLLNDSSEQMQVQDMVSALESACENNQPEVVAELLKVKAVKQQAFNAVVIASESNERVDSLAQLLSHKSVSAVAHNEGNAALKAAVEKNNNDAVELLLKVKGVKENCKDALYDALKSDKPEAQEVVATFLTHKIARQYKAEFDSDKKIEQQEAEFKVAMASSRISLL